MKRAGILGEHGGRVNPFRESEQGHWSGLCFLRKYSVVQAGRNVSLVKSDQCASDLFRCRDSSPWPLLFLLGVQPGEDINHGLFGSMAEGFHPRDDRQLGGFHGVTCFLLLAPSDGVGAEVTELQDVAFSRLDEKTLFNDLAEPEGAGFAAQETDGFFNVGHDLVVLVGNQYSERRAGRGAKEFVYDLRGEDKGDIVWVDGDARTVSLKEPLRVAFFNDGSAHEA